VILRYAQGSLAVRCGSPADPGLVGARLAMRAATLHLPTRGFRDAICKTDLFNSLWEV